MLPRLLIAIALLTMASAQAATRQDTLLPDGWKFIQSDAGPTASTDTWQPITVPHTWNTVAADSGDHKGDPNFKYGYFRGACWYARSLDIPADWKGKRVFIRFEAASLVARTYINGQLLGEHRGGFTAFCYELTPFLHFGGANELRVQVDNSHQDDVPPLSGDFNIDGGIYRPVHLIVTDPLCISPLDMASPGVFITTKSLTDSTAKIQVETIVNNGSPSAADLQVKADIADPSGKIVASGVQPVTVASGTIGDVFASVDLPSPHLWNARKDPYLYTVTVSLLHGNDTSDSIQQPLGVRTVAITEDKGFLLNGQPYPIYGVNKHQDWGDHGWAETTANYDEDAQLILDMGTTAIRLAHYPQSEYFHDLCDHNGLLLWNEVSLVNEIRDTPAFSANAEQQLRELILQRYNHPSVAFWGLFNELNLVKTAPPDALLAHLKTVVQGIDQTRIIVCAIAKANKSYNTVADHPCFNRYPGWYNPFGQMDSWIRAGVKEVGKRIALSEYGAGSNIAQHEEGPLVQPNPKGPYHPEEWQTHVHEADWTVMKDNPVLWGGFIWVMFDFQVASRNEGSQPHINDKGLVTQDRRTKKDSYYFYQANWSDKPMVYIASKRMTPRRLSTTDVEVFSNCDSVALTVNGKSLGAMQPDKVRVFRWPNVALQSGPNQIEVVASSSSGKFTDSCQWVLDPAAAPTPPGPGTAYKAPKPSPAATP